MQEHQLSIKQKQCVEFKGRDLLITGEPGSGKTVVILRRARNFGAQGDRVYIFTFGKVLAKYAKQLVKGLNLPNVSVTNFDEWAIGALRRAIGKRITVIEQRNRTELIDRILVDAQAKHSRVVLREGVEFFGDEIAWIKGKLISDQETYLAAERTGRGKALGRRDRLVAWEVFEEYERRLEKNGLIDWDDLAPLLLKHLDAVPRLDHILIDEAQDMHGAELRLLREVADKTLTIAADEAQKIYKTTFTWSDVGINLKGSGSKKLTTMFRSTEEIVRLADSLRQHDPLVKKQDTDGTAVAYVVQGASGTLPQLYITASEREEDLAVVRTVHELRHAHKDAIIGVLARSWSKLFRIQSALQDRRISCEVIKKADGDATTPGVKLISMHSAKGLEFDFVLMAGVTDGVLPPAPPEGLSQGELDDLLGPELRLLYVSMTRAKFGLFMTCVRERSRFLHLVEPGLYEEHIL